MNAEKVMLYAAYAALVGGGLTVIGVALLVAGVGFGGRLMGVGFTMAILMLLVEVGAFVAVISKP